MKYQTAPKINEASKKIVEVKQKSEDPVHLRLYNKRNSKERKQMLLEQNKKTKKVPIKKVEEITNTLYQDAMIRNTKQKELAKTKKEEKVIKSSENSNKFILKKFNKQYREEVEKLFNEIIENDKNFNNKLNLSQLTVLLQNLNFISKDNNENNENQVQNINKNTEKKLIIDIYDTIKDKDELINLDHLFIFLLSILNLLEYYIIKSTKQNENIEEQNEVVKSNSQKTLKTNGSTTKVLMKNSSTLTLSDEATQNLIHKLNLELTKRIIVNKKYGGFDEEDNYIISFTHAKQIQKDYTLFAFNWSSFIHNGNKKRMTEPSEKKDLTFKPKINKKSELLCNEYRKKVVMVT
jgi:hypothetical protein